MRHIKIADALTMLVSEANVPTYIKNDITEIARYLRLSPDDGALINCAALEFLKAVMHVKKTGDGSVMELPTMVLRAALEQHRNVVRQGAIRQAAQAFLAKYIADPDAHAEWNDIATAFNKALSL